MRALSQLGQQIILLLLRLGPDSKAIVQCKGSAGLFTFERSIPKPTPSFRESTSTLPIALSDSPGNH